MLNAVSARPVDPPAVKLRSPPRRPVKRSPVRQAGAMHEINYVVWPAVYGTTGYLIGALAGGAWIGAAVGAILGVAVAIVYSTRPFFDVELMAPLMLIASFFLISSPWRPWTGLAICTLPWLRMGLSRLADRERSTGTGKSDSEDR